jgi:hypothetical protein
MDGDVDEQISLKVELRGRAALYSNPRGAMLVQQPKKKAAACCQKRKEFEQVHLTHPLPITPTLVQIVHLAYTGPH